MIDVQNLSVRQGDFQLADVSFRVPAGKYAILMGQTGSGKTTLLEALAGLRPIASGRVRLGDRDVADCAPAERNVGYVPQDGALFRTMSVRDNLAFALTIRHHPAAAIQKAAVAELADWLGVTHLLDRLPIALSGGETQRSRWAGHGEPSADFAPG